MKKTLQKRARKTKGRKTKRIKIRRTRRIKEKKAKKEKKRKEAAQTEEDEDSDMVEAKRQKIAAVTPQSAAPSTPATGGEDSGESPGSSSKASEVGKTDGTSEKPHAAPAPAEAVKPDDEKKRQEKAAKNNAALTQLALHRASTADLADKLDGDRKSTPGSTTSAERSEAGDTVASEDVDLTDKQKVIRHAHLNRFARAVKSAGLNQI